MPHPIRGTWSRFRTGHRGISLVTANNIRRRIQGACAAQQLKLLNLVEDYEIIQRAYDDAAEIVARDIELARSVTEEMILEEFEYLDKS